MKRALRELEEASKRLDEDQKRIARRNGRRVMLAALRKVRRVLDDNYPNIPKKGGVRKKRKKWSPPRNWTEIPQHPIQHYHRWMKTIAESGAPFRDGWVPNWVIAVGPHTAKLKAAKNNRTKQQIALSAYLLEKSGF